MLEVAKILKLTLLGQIPQKFDPRFLTNFPGDPIFFKILTTDTKRGIIPRSAKVGYSKGPDTKLDEIL